MATVHIPSLMRDLTTGQAAVVAPGRTVRQVIDALDQAYPGIKARLCEGNRLGPTIAVSVDGRIAPLGLLAPVKEQSQILFLPAVGGG
jgi:molybdopterin synthase sulfur carrier subunit